MGLSAGRNTSAIEGRKKEERRRAVGAWGVVGVIKPQSPGFSLTQLKGQREKTNKA